MLTGISQDSRSVGRPELPEDVGQGKALGLAVESDEVALPDFRLLRGRVYLGSAGAGPEVHEFQGRASLAGRLLVEGARRIVGPVVAATRQALLHAHAGRFWRVLMVEIK